MSLKVTARSADGAFFVDVIDASEPLRELGIAHSIVASIYLQQHATHMTVAGALESVRIYVHRIRDRHALLSLIQQTAEVFGGEFNHVAC